MTFQEIILALEKFWSDYGCIIQQPLDIEVGAGTFNPATALRALGPEPWQVAYVEPSRRPTDGRYGDNPYRLGAYYQYQVILKPAPDDIQELYLDSLKVLEIDPKKNDLRFVEDDWESPTLGASGLGWEVWWNGAEITQFTYFQQMGSLELTPISVELTYGLERIAMYLQDVNSIFDIKWNDKLVYGDVHHISEVEYSKYHFGVSTVEMLFSLFDTYEREASVCLDNGLVLPGLDYILKCSHTFNMLDARGVISVTERVSYIERVRNMARRCARAYVKQREEMGFPMMNLWTTGAQQSAKRIVAEGGAQQSAKRIVAESDFLLEIGTEEIPASYILPALEQLEKRASELLKENKIPFKEIRSLGTPRRLTLAIEGIATMQTDQSVEVIGPPKSVAYDKDGNPTRAAQGFARGQGVSVDDLDTVETDRGEYVCVRKIEKGRATIELLQEHLPTLITSLNFPMTMRWSNLRFARPIRWIVALLGDEVVDFALDMLVSGRQTIAHRSLSSGAIELVDADLQDYIQKLRDAYVWVSHEERRNEIQKQVTQFMLDNDCAPIIDEEILDTVTFLVEYPQAIMGSFNESHLSLPSEVLTTSMKSHQRYFPCWKNESELLAKFITISNGTDGNFDGVRHGNERVLGARLDDAEFFYQEDQISRLAEKVDKLKNVVFQVKLGNLYEKSCRVKELAILLCEQLGFDENATKKAARAAYLCKADLTTQLVIEFPSLQGTMGKYYAANSSEYEEVATAIEEHYQPLAADAQLPKTDIGAIVSIADKLDTIAGYFGIGEVPTGAGDQFSLRRQAIGIARISHDKNFHIPLDITVEKAVQLYGDKISAETKSLVLDFFKTRIGVLLRESGYSYDVADAVLSADATDIVDALERAELLTEFRKRDDFDTIYPAFYRTIRIIPERSDTQVNEGLLIEKSEKQLYSEICELEPALTKLAGAKKYPDILDKLTSLQPAIDNFFNEVLVMAKEKELRENRLALLNKLADWLYLIADFTKLVIAGS